MPEGYICDDCGEFDSNMNRASKLELRVDVSLGTYDDEERVLCMDCAASLARELGPAVLGSDE
jgi:hypothetical protein